MKAKKKRRYLTLFLLIAVLLAGAVWAFPRLERKMLFPGEWMRRHDPAPPVAPNIEEWRRALDGDQPVHALFMKSNSGAFVRKPVVVYAHGNGELIQDWPDRLRPYNDLGLHVLLVEYRGFGSSGGVPSQDNITDDFIYFLSKLERRDDVDTGRIMLHGRSLGGGVVCSVARRQEPAALILQSTFTSVIERAKEMWVPGFLVSQRFDNLSYIKHYEGPLLLIHGENDKLIPVTHAQRLRAHHKTARLETYPCDHNNCPGNRKAYWRSIGRFLVESGIIGQRTPEI